VKPVKSYMGERKTHEASGRSVDGTPEANPVRLGALRYLICNCERWPVSSKRG
jgi:hypothetical protein